MLRNEYKPYATTIQDITPYTDKEAKYRLSFEGEVKPGQFFIVSLPKYGEAPISVCGYGPGFVELTIRNTGRVTSGVHIHQVGNQLYLRGPYGNGFDLKDYRGKELVVVVGGIGLAPVRGLVDYFASHQSEIKSLSLLVGFKSLQDILYSEELERWKKTINLVVTLDHADEDCGYPVCFVTDRIEDMQLDDPSNAAGIVVGPPMMMNIAANRLQKIGLQSHNVWISHERKMCCGLGKCGHCKVNSTYICFDGPVFRWDIARDFKD